MADKHPYVTSPGGLTKAINHFRNSFPSTVNSKTLEKLGFAPNNESYVINVLRFLGLIDGEGKKTDKAAEVFSIHDDTDFSAAFATVVKVAYSGLFDLHGDRGWSLGKDDLISFFRGSDQTTATVGDRQTSTFRLLARFSGHEETPRRKPQKNIVKKPAVAKGKERGGGTDGTARENFGMQTVSNGPGVSRVGLTVRIEINLPADGDQETYDRIFKSIRENFLNG